MGLLSDGGVHSHYQHLFALLKLAKEQGLADVFVHGFLDGRDVGPTTAIAYIEETEKQMADIGIGQFASIHGRYYAMDRDKRWDRVALTYNVLVDGVGQSAESAKGGITESYEREVTDEFVIPFSVQEHGEAVATIGDNDAVIFFNFRPDRAIQLSKVFTNSDFNGLALSANHPKNLKFVSFTHYSDEVNAQVAYENDNLKKIRLVKC